MVVYSACGHSAPSLSTTSVRANAGAVLKQKKTDESMARRRSFIDLSSFKLVDGASAAHLFEVRQRQSTPVPAKLPVFGRYGVGASALQAALEKALTTLCCWLELPCASIY